MGGATLRSVYMALLERLSSSFNRSHAPCSHVETFVIMNIVSSWDLGARVSVVACHQAKKSEGGGSNHTL